MNTHPPLKGLESRREFRHMSQSEAGKIVGVSQSHYRKFETGDTRLDVHRAKLLADAFECRIEDLL